MRSLFKSVTILGIEQDPEVVRLIPEILRYNKFRRFTQYADISTFTAFGEYRFAMGETKVNLEIIQGDIRKTVPDLSKRDAARDWDVIFHDPFSPKRAPELWTIDFFQSYFELLRARSGKVLTYSSAAAIRGAMKSAGFSVFRSTALGGKSGGTVGSIDLSQYSSGNPYIFALTEDENARLGSASGIPYRDQSFAASSADIRAGRLVEQVEWHQLRKQK